MTKCVHCGKSFNPHELPDEPAVQAGLLLTEVRYNDAGTVCGDCLASRGRLAMMYDPDCRR